MKGLRILLPIFGSLFLLLITAAGLSYAQEPLDQSFTYQGKLELDDQPVNAACDFQFGLYDAAANGNQLGSTQTESLTVTDGLFTALLNDSGQFGPHAFAGEARWLEISVQCPGDSSLNHLGRQPLTAAPYAHYASSTGALDGQPLASTLPLTGQILTWDGTAWRPAAATDAITATWATTATFAADADTLDGHHAGAFAPLGSSWTITGNGGIDPAANFIGTTDNVSFTVRVNNAQALQIVPNADSPNILAGYSGNWVAPGVFGAVIGGGGQNGNLNRVVDHVGVVGGGQNNQAGSDNGSVGDNTLATVAGGESNTASGTLSAIGGGLGNTASGYISAVGGGRSNAASGYVSTVGGGRNNAASGTYAFVGGGYSNQASGPIHGYSTVAGGWDNTAAGDVSFIGGGAYNDISGGYYNAIAAGANSLITTTGWANIIGGGYGHVISGTMAYATIGGGRSNNAGNSYVTIAGGRGNTAGGAYATVAGGQDNTASGDWAVAGGRANTVSGSYATVPGGVYASATHFGEMAYANGGFAVAGDAQTSVYVLRREYAMAAGAWHDLFLDGNSASQRLTIAPGRTVTFDMLVTGSTAACESAGYRIEGIIENISGVTALVGTPTVTVLGEDDAAWNVQVLASDDLDALLTQAQGNGETIRWVARVNTAEVNW
jgi:trimeric autotransporter adhesin